MVVGPIGRASARAFDPSCTAQTLLAVVASLLFLSASLEQHTPNTCITNTCHTGLAAGFDKDAEAIEPLLNLGFGFIEVGECCFASCYGGERVGEGEGGGWCSGALRPACCPVLSHVRVAQRIRLKAGECVWQQQVWLGVVLTTPLQPPPHAPFVQAPSPPSRSRATPSRAASGSAT